jgi:uncharacterized protein (TIGR02217 family)
MAPVALVDIVRRADGTEQRRSRRSKLLRRFDVGQNIRTEQMLYDVMSLFQLMNGPLHTFAFKDELDYKSCTPEDTIAATDADLGLGDGVTTEYQLRKQYSLTLLDGSTVISTERNVYLPVRNTVLINVNGVAQDEGVHFTVNYDTGVITFMSPPSASFAITAGFEFYIRVRFDTNDLSQSAEEWNSGSTPSIPLIEVIE